MCGIVGYVGQRPACEIVVDALRRMEYRGYDSAGVALLDGSGGLIVSRKAGRVANLEAALDEAGVKDLDAPFGDDELGLMDDPIGHRQDDSD